MEEGQAHLTMEAKTQDQTVQNHVRSVQTQEESVQHKRRGGYTRSVQEEAQTVQDLSLGPWPSIFTHKWVKPRIGGRRPCTCYMEAHQGWLSNQCSIRKHKLVLYVIYPRFCAHSRTLAHMAGHVVHVPCAFTFPFHFAHISCGISLGFTASLAYKRRCLALVFSRLMRVMLCCQHCAIHCFCLVSRT